HGLGRGVCVDVGVGGHQLFKLLLEAPERHMSHDLKPRLGQVILRRHKPADSFLDAIYRSDGPRDDKGWLMGQRPWWRRGVARVLIFKDGVVFYIRKLAVINLFREKVVIYKRMRSFFYGFYGGGQQ